MTASAEAWGDRPDAAAVVEARLRGEVTGEVRFDALSRTIYSTDASIYEIVPLGVVLPKTVDDVAATLKVCSETRTPLIARGGATGLTGGAVGAGVQLDLSRHLNAIGPVDLDAKTVEVQAGVVLDELNAHLRPHNLHFAPDVATGSRATIGGMIANNSCGARSIIYGRTVDHVAALTVALADGELVAFGNDCGSPEAPGARAPGRAAAIAQELSRIRDGCFAEIQRRFPKILRSNGGYGLDRLGPPGAPADAVKILCGSEGTLGVVVGATLRLTDLPRHTGLVLFHFHDVFGALGAASEFLKLKPSAVELIDRLIIDAGRANAAIARRCDYIKGEPGALLIVEVMDDEAVSLDSRLKSIAGTGDAHADVIASEIVRDPPRQAHVWNLRKSGLGLLMSRPGDSQPYAFVEDSAVDPRRLREYIERFTEILHREGVSGAGYYAHASVGCIHMRPVLNLKDRNDVERMRRIADAVSDLALQFGGAMTGEHGDGIVRSCWLEKMYGTQIMGAFRLIKKLFDPHGVLNPHKIVEAWDMTEHLRYGPSPASAPVKTHLDFGPHGGMLQLAEMCSGVGACRQRLVGTMCPSYMATNDEKHTTRARATALRVALSNRGLLHGLDDPHLEEVMDLCISCKACKSECPTGVDMARLKSEYESHRNLLYGVGRRSRLVADTPRLAASASRFPRTVNFVAGSRMARAWAERRYGLDRRIPPPAFARRTFRSWFRRHKRAAHTADAPGKRVIYFVDTWTNYFTPQVGMAAVKLLERMGFAVTCPAVFCCGRPAISKGLLSEAKQLAERNVLVLVRSARAGVSIVGTEPSCVSALIDEYPQLVRSRAARLVADRTEMIEGFLRRAMDEEPNGPVFGPRQGALLYHAHCHQKALGLSEDAADLLSRAWGEDVTQIDSGCCGMAGSFGHEKEHYEVARAIGEQRLFPMIRARPEASVAVSGFSCRHQIAHHTSATPRHMIEYLADVLVS